MNKSLRAAVVKVCTSGGGPLFHSSYDGVVARKMLPTQSIFHQPEQMGRQKVPNPDYTMGVVRRSSQAWQCALRSSNLCGSWRYHVARELKPIFSSIHSSLDVIRWWADQDALHFVVWQLFMAVRNVACLARRCRHCWNAPPTSSLC